MMFHTTESAAALAATIQQATARCSQRMAADGLTPPQPCEKCGAGPCRVEPVITRIEFAPGHEDERLTQQDVSAAMLKMNAAGQMYEALMALVGSVTQQDARGNVYALGKLHAAVGLAKEAIAAAEGRSPQEPA